MRVRICSCIQASLAKWYPGQACQVAIAGVATLFCEMESDEASRTHRAGLVAAGCGRASVDNSSFDPASRWPEPDAVESSLMSLVLASLREGCAAVGVSEGAAPKLLRFLTAKRCFPAAPMSPSLALDELWHW